METRPSRSRSLSVPRSTGIVSPSEMTTAIRRCVSGRKNATRPRSPSAANAVARRARGPAAGARSRSRGRSRPRRRSRRASGTDAGGRGPRATRRRLASRGSRSRSCFATARARSSRVGSVGARRASIDRVTSTTTSTSEPSRPLVLSERATTGCAAASATSAATSAEQREVDDGRAPPGGGQSERGRDRGRAPAPTQEREHAEHADEADERAHGVRKLIDTVRSRCRWSPTPHRGSAAASACRRSPPRPSPMRGAASAPARGRRRAVSFDGSRTTARSRNSIARRTKTWRWVGELRASSSISAARSTASCDAPARRPDRARTCARARARRRCGASRPRTRGSDRAACSARTGRPPAGSRRRRRRRAATRRRPRGRSVSGRQVDGRAGAVRGMSPSRSRAIPAEHVGGERDEQRGDDHERRRRRRRRRRDAARSVPSRCVPPGEPAAPALVEREQAEQRGADARRAPTGTPRRASGAPAPSVFRSSSGRSTSTLLAGELDEELPVLRRREERDHAQADPVALVGRRAPPSARAVSKPELSRSLSSRTDRPRSPSRSITWRASTRPVEIRVPPRNGERPRALFARPRGVRARSPPPRPPKPSGRPPDRGPGRRTAASAAAPRCACRAGASRRRCRRRRRGRSRPSVSDERPQHPLHALRLLHVDARREVEHDDAAAAGREVASSAGRASVAGEAEARRAGAPSAAAASARRSQRVRRCSPPSSSAAEVGSPPRRRRAELAHAAAISATRRSLGASGEALDLVGARRARATTRARAPRRRGRRARPRPSSRATRSSARRRSGAAAPFAAAVRASVERLLERLGRCVARRRLAPRPEARPEAAREPRPRSRRSGQRAEQDERDGERAARTRTSTAGSAVSLARQRISSTSAVATRARDDRRGGQSNDSNAGARVVLEPVPDAARLEVGDPARARRLAALAAGSRSV